MATTSHRFINPDGLPAPNGYTHVVEARGSRMLFISGQVSIDSQGNLVGANDMRAQAEQVFKNLRTALDADGASFADVVKLTFFMTDIAQIQAVRNVRDQYVNMAQPPASSAVEVRQLVRPEYLLEIEAIAVLKD